MKAIHLAAYDNPAQSLMMVEVSEPNAPSASEALVRMEYAPINYSDLLLANGVYFLNPKLPSVGRSRRIAASPAYRAIHRTDERHTRSCESLHDCSFGLGVFVLETPGKNREVVQATEPRNWPGQTMFLS
jgi:hypothetical protein